MKKKIIYSGQCFIMYLVIFYNWDFLGDQVFLKKYIKIELQIIYLGNG